MTALLIILYIGLAIMNAVAMARNSPDAETENEVDVAKGLLKPYTLTILSATISIIFFMESSVAMGCLFAINAVLDLRIKA